MSGWALFAGRFGGVGSVSFLTYLGEYASYIIVLAFLSDKLTVGFNLGLYGYGVVGPISGAYLVVSGLVAVPIGHLCDKYGRRRFTILGSLIGAAGLFLLVVVDQIQDLTAFILGIGIALIALGIGHGTYTASTLAYTGDLATPDDVGKPYSLVEMAEFAAYAFGPALGAALALGFGRTGTFVFSGFMLLGAAGIAAAFMREPQSPAGAGNDVHSHVASWSDLVTSLRSPVVGAVLLTTLIAALGFSAFFYYVPVYAYSLRGSVPEFAYLYPVFASIMAGVGVLSMLPLGAFEDATRRRMPILVAGLLIGSLSLLAVFISATTLTLVIASGSFGVSIALARVSQLVVLGEHSTFENRAAIMGTNHAIEHAGYGIGAVVGGVFAAAFGFGPTFRFLALILLVAAIGFYGYARILKLK